MRSTLDVKLKILTAIHRTAFDLTRGRLAGRFAGMPVVKLTTTGRKSGKRRHTMLTTPIHDATRIVLIASKGGAAQHPAWYVNLRTNPEVTVTMHGNTRTMTAQTATAAEKAALWPDIVAVHRGYAGYQDKTDREIPVVILTPTD
ncbi:MAG: nitroreductase family deazaflavin-dependent oxidoreductase [Actinomycetota bacterium]|nr:nitroreductase family deazaflavin-dependent oxidoreductase [Actinomycetota bacterium]